MLLEVGKETLVTPPIASPCQSLRLLICRHWELTRAIAPSPLWFRNPRSLGLAYVTLVNVNFIFGVPQPAVSHAQALDVNAGDALFAFTVPQGTIVRARQRDAGDAAFAFETVSEPTVTLLHTYTVDAGDSAFTVAVPQVSATRVGVMGTDHEISAGNANFAFISPQAAITKTDALELSALVISRPTI